MRILTWMLMKYIIDLYQYVFSVFFKIEQLATDLNCIVEKLYAEITEQSR